MINLVNSSKMELKYLEYHGTAFLIFRIVHVNLMEGKRKYDNKSQRYCEYAEYFYCNRF